MARREKTGTRFLDYNVWHREDSINRFVGSEDAGRLFACDVDFVEYALVCKNCYSELTAGQAYCPLCNRNTLRGSGNAMVVPLLLVETGFDTGDSKIGGLGAIRALAEAAGIEA